MIELHVLIPMFLTFSLTVVLWEREMGAHCWKANQKFLSLGIMDGMGKVSSVLGVELVVYVVGLAV